MGALTTYLDNSGCYSMTMDTTCKQLKKSREDITLMAELERVTIFTFGGVEYLGTSRGLKDYNHDKMIGQNPFHQTY